MSVGRLLNCRPDVCSLINILQKLIKQGRKFITKEWFVSQYKKQQDPGGLEGWYASMGEDHFEEYANEDGLLDISSIRHDLKDLKEKADEIIKLRHKRIAHRDQNNNIEFDGNFDDLKLAIETIDRLTVKYVSLLEQAAVVEGTMEPA